MAKTNPWMAVSDLMTGLMVIFLFVAITYICKEQERIKADQEKIEEEQRALKEEKSIIIDYVDNKRKLKDNLESQFQAEIQAGTITITGDLSMRFENAESLFESGSTQLKPRFKEQLARIVPRYLKVLLLNSLRSSIREIRIEGHTDETSVFNDPEEAYRENLRISQERARNVLFYIRSLPEFESYSNTDRDLLNYWFTANGLSFGRALDANGGYAQLTHQPISRDRSRRVEIRIIAADDEALIRFTKGALENE